VLKADNLPPSCAVVTKSEKLNCLEPSGHLLSCNGTDLPLPVLEHKVPVSGVGGCGLVHMDIAIGHYRTCVMLEYLKDEE